MPFPVDLNRRRGFSFFEMVAGVMALLKLKGKYDEYRQTAADDEEGRVALTDTPVAEGFRDSGNGTALLDTEIPASSRRTRKKKACCMCCGLDCSLFWKAIGIVLVLYTLWYGFKAIKWAVTDAPTGLEDFPAFSSSLGCVDAPYVYNNTEVTVLAPIGTRHHDHSFDVRGYGVGTVTIADGDPDSKEVKYEFSIRSNRRDMLDDVRFVYPSIHDDKIVTNSRFIIETSRIPGINSSKCMRFDVKLYVPPNLKNLAVKSHANTHIQFAPDARINVDELAVTLFTSDSINVIVPSPKVTAKKVSLEVYRGWIVGEASIVEETSITTQRGDGVANVKVYPAAPADPENPLAATFRTTTGAGRSDFTYIGRKAFKRPIDSTHISSRNADVYLSYRQSEFSGKIEMSSKSYTMTGTQSLESNGTVGDENKPKWTHFVGDRDGGDQMYVNSRGWTGLYF